MLVQHRMACGLLAVVRQRPTAEASMRRRDFTKLALAGTVASVAAPAVARAQTTFNWKMTSFYGPNAAFYSTGPGSAKDLIKRIEDDVGRPHQDPVLRRRRTDSRRRRLRRRVGRHRRDELRQRLFLDRQDVRRPVLHRRAVRPQLPGPQRLDVRRRRARRCGARSTTASIWCRSCAATPACR